MSPKRSRILSVFLTLALLLPTAAGRADGAQGSKAPTGASVLLSPGQARKAAFDEAVLEAGPAAVTAPVTVTMSALAARDLPALDQGMVNVTKGPRKGYRFLPHMTFQAPLRITLPFDRSLLPPGYTDDDVQTFYYDTERAAWQALDRLAVDAGAQSVTSATDHFTDFINAVVTVPETPGLFTENPNAMADVAAAHPGEGMSLIAAPSPDNTGAARLAYPLDLPPGRNGVQPTLEIGYNSSAGNGWLGVGWDLALPAITVETRWGVPRYSPGFETESYLVDGQQLTPLAERAPPEPRTAEKSFSTRVEGDFLRIVRHGTGPANYAWEVTNQTGTRFLYGDDPAGAPGSYTLRDAAGNIFKWALREQVDLNGNRMTYSYAQVAEPGVAGGSVPGVQLYPRSINYTGWQDRPGAYTVTFYGDRDLAGARPDPVIDARGGFKMVTADRLRRVTVTFNGETVRTYDLQYQTGAFAKSLLASITQLGTDGSIFNTHRFEYYTEPQSFAAPEVWDSGSDSVAGPVIDIGGASAISSSVTTGGGGHIYIGFNPEEPTKANSAGGKIGFNYSENQGVLELVDVTGDGLPDKVFKSGDTWYYRPNLSGPAGGQRFGDAQPLYTLPGLSSEQAFTISGGAEAYPGPLSVFVNQSETFTTGDTYLADINADGLTDLVAGGQVLFGYLQADGTPAFTADSSSSPVPVGAGTVDAGGVIPDYEQLYQQQLEASPLQDTLRRWVAPYDGTIAISGDVALIEDTSAARAKYRTADGVRVAIQHNGSELWSSTIGPDDYTAKTPAGVNGVAVNAGDRIYFRVQSVFDGAYDQVAWDPEIRYVGAAPATDVNGLDPYRYQAAADFVLAGRSQQSVRMPYSGTVRLTGALKKTAVTTDDAAITVTRNGAAVFSQSLAWNATVDTALDQAITVAKGDLLQFSLRVDSPIDLTQLQWFPLLTYTATTDAPGGAMPVFSPPYGAATYPLSNLTQPQSAWTVPQTGAVTVTPQLGATIEANGTVTFTVKRQGALLAKHTLTVTAGAVSGGSFTVDVTKDDQLYFDFSASDPELSKHIFSPAATAAYDQNNPFSLPVALHTAAPQGLFGQPYRGWAYAGYNGNGDRAVQPVDEALLVINADGYRQNCDPAQLTTPEALSQANCRPDQAKAYAYAPTPENRLWQGPARSAWVDAGHISSSRLGAPYITVPRPGQFAGARAVSRISRTSQTSVGGGVSVVSGSVSGDPLPGDSWAEVEMLDMNGDGFPDVVGNGHIQYTNPDGSLETASRSFSDLDKVRGSRDFAYNVGIGGNPAHFRADAGGTPDSGSNNSPKSGKTGSQMVELGFSGDLGGGHSDSRFDLIDMNGDGLPDRVTYDGATLLVALNLGYSFAAAEAWGAAAISQGASRDFSIGVSPGFNGGDYDFAGGVSLAASESRAGCTAVNPITGDCSAGYLLADLNGDGLPDRLQPAGSKLRVAFNTGAGFAAEVDWNGALGDAVAISRDTNLGGGAYFTIGIGPLCIEACYLIINPGFDVSQSMARQELTLMDVNGDGYPDHLSSTDDGQLTVARSQVGDTNLLRTVYRPLGSSISLEYERKGNTYADPNSRWVLSKLVTDDGQPGDGVDQQITTYQYEGGYYSRLEREFYGFSRVTDEERDAAAGEALYRSTVREYLNDSFYDHGLLVRELLTDADHRPYTETIHAYAFRDVATGTDTADLQSLTATVFPHLLRTDQRYYEGGPAPLKSTYVTYVHDSLGRITRMEQSGDVGAADDLSIALDYPQCPATYVASHPTLIAITDQLGKLLRRREATVDCATGNLLQEREYVDAATVAITDLSYYPEGSPYQVTEPPNSRGQRYQRTYTYDPYIAAHVTSVTDSFGYRSAATYDFRFGELTSQTDINGGQTTYAYDAYGRLTGVTGPYEQGTGIPTVWFEYHPDAAVPWALTRRADPFRSATDPIDTVLFSDGYGRTIQTKEDATVYTGPDSVATDVMVVSGRVTYDVAGRIAAQYYPVTEPLGTPGLFNPTYDAVSPTVTAYDVLDRITTVTLPDGTATRYTYGFGTDRSGTDRFETVITDANGVQKRLYHDTGKRITAVKQYNQGGADTIWTSYEYDPLGQLTQVVDDQQNVTRVAYDGLGRRTAIDSPDAGLTEYQYDRASNVIREITANLRAAGQAISYRYDYNRLTDISHANFPATDVHYDYGAPGAANNAAGEIIRVQDQSGIEERAYGLLGEVTRTVKTVADDNPGNKAPAVYTTSFRYDSFARLQQLTYPDGEVLTYRYDSGGQLASALGVKAGQTYSYVNRAEYDKFGAPAFRETGNHVKTQYQYDAQSRRLTRLQAGKGAGNLFQNQAYSYDNVGNVIRSANEVSPPKPSEYGGPSVQNFTYDDLYRLTAATGTYRFGPDKTRRYSMQVAYDSINNLLTKQQTDEITQPSGTTIPQHETTYSLSYAYGSSRPHAATHIGDRTYSYDANGNQAGWASDLNGTNRRIVWDDENRIQSIYDNGHQLAYKYNDQGLRVVKQGPQGETVYVNQYFTVRNREIGTKHVWIGEGRLASKLVKQPKKGVPTDGDGPLEKDLYFYHADRNGDNGYVTDAQGKLYEHTEYFPFGEVWVQEKSNTQRTPYLFAGKELDEETDLYYYGARYYDPQTSLWQSTDPALGDYLNGQENTGVYNPFNIDLYNYADLNPVTYTDPDGRAKHMVPYFSSPRAKYARQMRAQGNIGGRNIATLAFTKPDGSHWVKSLTSNGKHSEKRLYDWYAANCNNCTVRWLYTELAPCGSDVHNCNRRVKQWFGNNVTVYYSIAYPSWNRVNAVSSITGAVRNIAARKLIAKARRHRAVLVLKNFNRTLRARHANGTPLTAPFAFRANATDYVDESDNNDGVLP